MAGRRAARRRGVRGTSPASAGGVGTAVRQRAAPDHGATTTAGYPLRAATTTSRPHGRRRSLRRRAGR
ncbi:hypothetical protein CFC35_09355 [Streptomyces sp. FBKL.4005]|nr:hypothetical protein CFC35_09355 [Streptomyces sp. FBKL.4005]